MNEVIFFDGHRFFQRKTYLSEDGFKNTLRKYDFKFVAFKNINARTSIEPIFRPNNDYLNIETNTEYIKNNYEPEQVDAAFRKKIYAVSAKDSAQDEISKLEEQKNKLMGEVLTLENENKRLDRKRAEIREHIEYNDRMVEQINEECDSELEQIEKERQAFIDSLTDEEREILKDL